MSSPGTTSTLYARRAGRPGTVEIRTATTTLTSVGARTARRGGPVEIKGEPYLLERTGFPHQYRLSSVGGHPVATATRSGLRGWEIELGGGRILTMTRPALGGREVLLDRSGRQIGGVRPVPGGVDADLPGLDQPTAVLVLVVALAGRRRRRRAVLLGS